MQKTNSYTKSEIQILAITKKYQPLSNSWNQAIGIGRNKKKLLEAHAKKIREEWQ